jgi:hypothetical protein
MKLNTSILIVLVVIISTLIGSLLWQKNQLDKLSKDIDQKAQIITQKDQTLELVQTKNGELVGRVHTLEIDKKNFQLSFSDQLEYLKERIGKIDNLQNYVTAGIKSVGRIYTDVKDSIRMKDSSLVRSFTKDDKYLFLTCDITKDSALCNYIYQDSVKVIIYNSRNWRWYQFTRKAELKKQGFEKYSSKTEVSFSNPNTKPIYIQSVSLKK